MLNFDTLSTRLFWAAVVLVVLAVAWHNLTRLAPETPDLSRVPVQHQLEEHRDRLIDHAHDVDETIEEAG